jgi:hypothetical protein
MVSLKTASVVQVQGTLADSSGAYSASLFADQNFTASAFMFTPLRALSVSAGSSSDTG